MNAYPKLFQVDGRPDSRSSIAEKVVSSLQSILRKVNPFVTRFTQHYENKEYRENDVKLLLTADGPSPDSNADARCYTSPTSSQVAAILSDHDTGANRDVIISFRSQESKSHSCNLLCFRSNFY